MAHEKLTPREKRKIRHRKKLHGTAERPRLCVFRSNRYLYAQLIDDDRQFTLGGVSSLKVGGGRANLKAAESLGGAIAEVAKSKNVQKVVFDCNGFLYHGVIKQIAESARSGGLQF